MRRQTFLSELMPLGVCMRLLGWFPTQRTTNSEGDPILQFKLVSKNTAYSAVLTSLQLANIVWHTIWGLKLVPKKLQQLQVQAYYILLFRATPHFLPAFIILQCHKQITFVEECMQLQSEVERCSISGKTINFGNTRRMVAIRVALIIGIGSALMTVRCFRLHRFLLEDVSLILGLVNEAFVFAWWHYAALVIQLLSTHILQEYQMLLEFNEGGNSGKLLAEAVLDLRSPWLKLFILSRDSGDVISLALINLFLSSFMRLLATAYLICSIPNVKSITFNVGTFLISLVTLVVICQTTHDIQRGIYLNVLKALENTKKLRICARSRSIMTDFLVHLTRNPPVVTFNGYINVGRPLLTTILSSFIAYITVIIQLSREEATAMTYEDVLHMYDYFYTKPINSTQ